MVNYYFLSVDKIYKKFDELKDTFYEKQNEYKKLISQNNYLSNHLYQLKVEQNALLNKNEEVMYIEPYNVKRDLLEDLYLSNYEGASLIYNDAIMIDRKIRLLENEIKFLTEENQKLSQKCVDLVKENAKFVIGKKDISNDREM